MKTPAVLDEYPAAIDAVITSLLDRVQPPLCRMITYHLGWTDHHGKPANGSRGKRLRATLCLLACEATEGDYREALPAAAAVELVHNLSLIQDDVQDDDAERRHRPTVWSIWGKPQALNAITAMHGLANLALSRLGENGTPFSKQQYTQRLLNETILKMSEGQYCDMSFEKRLDIDVSSYLDMIEGKTAALVSCSMEMGAVLGADERSYIEAFREFGYNLGLAFQIRDDILGIWGVSERTGKPEASDIMNKKKSFPLVYALETPKSRAREELIEVYEKETIDNDGVDRVLNILESIGAQAHSQGIAEEYRDRAIAELDRMTLSSRASSDLREVAHFLVGREF